MIKEDSILTLDDNNDYYVLSSIMNSGNNYVLLGQIDKENTIITENYKVMQYNQKEDKLDKVTDVLLLRGLADLFEKGTN